MTFTVTLDDDAAMNLLRVLGETAGDTFTLTVHEPWTERRFEPGDRVRVEFDNGPGWATVVGVSTSYGETFVSVTYGRGGKYRTSLPPSSVSTENVIHHPGSIEIPS